MKFYWNENYPESIYVLQGKSLKVIGGELDSHFSCWRKCSWKTKPEALKSEGFECIGEINGEENLHESWKPKKPWWKNPLKFNLHRDWMTNEYELLIPLQTRHIARAVLRIKDLKGRLKR